MPRVGIQLSAKHEHTGTPFCSEQLIRCALARAVRSRNYLSSGCIGRVLAVPQLECIQWCVGCPWPLVRVCYCERPQGPVVGFKVSLRGRRSYRLSAHVFGGQAEQVQVLPRP